MLTRNGGGVQTLLHVVSGQKYLYPLDILLYRTVLGGPEPSKGSTYAQPQQGVSALPVGAHVSQAEQ